MLPDPCTAVLSAGGASISFRDCGLFDRAPGRGDPSREGAIEAHMEGAR